METCRDACAWMQAPAGNLVFPDHCVIRSLHSFILSDLVFLEKYHPTEVISIHDSFRFMNTAKSFFLEAAERVSVSPFQVCNKNHLWIPLTSTNPSQPSPSDTSGMMTWLQRSAGDLLCSAKSAAFEKALNITESLKLTLKHNNGFSPQPNENSAAVQITDLPLCALKLL